jgi:hypothetical protein
MEFKTDRLYIRPVSLEDKETVFNYQAWILRACGFEKTPSFSPQSPISAIANI